MVAGPSCFRADASEVTKRLHILDCDVELVVNKRKSA
jgi:hypothetical protein